MQLLINVKVAFQDLSIQSIRIIQITKLIIEPLQIALTSYLLFHQLFQDQWHDFDFNIIYREEYNITNYFHLSTGLFEKQISDNKILEYYNNHQRIFDKQISKIIYLFRKFYRIIFYQDEKNFCIRKYAAFLYEMKNLFEQNDKRYYIKDIRRTQSIFSKLDPDLIQVQQVII
ncbi:unnamed protein product [Paramecium primaurelia]|uniref:Uncharacterized protein n=1 Tax=Paramecium primaurelia TaxID=5886 RepID=A0A8S1JSC3_PARPR|nr:unnamed protein product [Paramecium primaurelia]